MGTSRTAEVLPEITVRPAWAGREAILLGLLVCAAAIVGHLTRPIGAFSSFWPANALLLGILVRNPRLATPWGWGGAFAGYLAADLIAGGSLFVTLWLTAANLAGVVAGFALFQRLPEEDRRLRRPLSVLYLAAICAAAATAGAIVGGGAAAILFGRDLLTGFSFWFVSELVNNIVILPVILTAPGSGWRGKLNRPLAGLPALDLATVAPILALITSAMAEIAIGGPGTIAFPVLALLWCALRYSLFTTALLTLLVSAWEMIAVSAGIVSLPFAGDAVDAAMSFRLGVALLALGPLTVASVKAAQNDLVRSLDRAASYDSLTGALARHAFLQRGQRLLDRHGTAGSFVAVMVLDVDNFKGVNDRFGHAAGDHLLATLSGTVASALSPEDLFGRIGGDEFAIVTPRSALAEAVALAERIRREIDEAAIDLKSGDRVHVTVSAGVVTNGGEASAPSLESLLLIADQALYAAKARGRNQVVSA